MARKYNPDNHSPDPEEFQRLISASRRFAEVGNFEAATDAANKAVFYASNLDEVDQANGEARLHSAKWADERDATENDERKPARKPARKPKGKPKGGGGADVDAPENTEEALEAVAGMGGDKFALSYALVTQLGKSDDPDAQAMYRWLEGKAEEYFENPIGFSEEAYVREFNSQPWAQKYKSTAIQDMDFEAQFPQLYADALEADVSTLRDQAVQFGVQVSDEELTELAKQKRRFGMTQSQLNDAFAELATAKSGDFTGQTGVVQRDLQEWARRNGVSLAQNTIDNYVRRIRAGDTTTEDVLMELRRTYVAGAYPGWADRINNGEDIYDIAQPYRQTMASVLELGDADAIDFSDPLLKRGLQSVGADGKPRIMPLYEFEQEIRKDPRWEFTDNAYDVYSRVGENLLRTFGFR